MAECPPTVVGAAPKTPVTIITGFLGAGKTTLLNHILQAKGDRNISVIENEFGEVNIDNGLVADNLIEEEDLVSLDNGCVCCSLRKDIVKALAEIERRNRHRNRRSDQVVLETTGLADPAPVAFTFFANPWIASRFRLDSIVCVVDARYLLQHLNACGMSCSDGINETVQQLAFADLVLLNKTDLVSEAQLEAVRSEVGRINSSAKLIECQLNQEGGRPPLEELLDTHAFSVDRALAVDQTFLDSDSEASGISCSTNDGDSSSGDDDDVDSHSGDSGAATECCAASDGKQHGMSALAGAGAGGGSATAAAGGKCSAPAPGSSGRKRRAALMSAGSSGVSSHSAAAGQQQDVASPAPPRERRPKRRRKQLHDLAGFGSVGIVARGPLDEYRFNWFMRDLLAERSHDIIRCKGVLAVHGYGDQKFVFQGVHETICYGPADKPWAPDEPRINQIVFIGKDLDRRSLMEGFRTCVWQPLAEGWKEAHDPMTGQPYYWNPQTGQKTWARPNSKAVEAKPEAAGVVTATRLQSLGQPRSLQPSSKSRRGSCTRLTALDSEDASPSAVLQADVSVSGLPSPVACAALACPAASKAPTHSPGHEGQGASRGSCDGQPGSA